jgi:aerobic carbon-monoxide dehydrogenase medium subunit
MRGGSLKPCPFEYHRPHTVAEAVELLATLDNAKVLAGGQSLMPMLNMRFVMPDHVIDLNFIDELAYLREDGDAIVVGAMTRQRDIELSPIVRARLPLLSEALRFTGHTQTRNRGTLGGSLCHLDPAAEQPAVALTCEAEIIATSRRGQRAIPMTEFPVTYMTTQLEPDEIVTEIQLPIPPKKHGYAFLEFARRHGDFALASAAVLMVGGRDGLIERIAITIGGVGSMPKRLTVGEAILRGNPPDDVYFTRAVEACAELDVVEDVHANAAYRRQLARVLTRRALRHAAQHLSSQT